jgi:hypothetical protein
MEHGKAIPVTDCGGPQGCETSRLPHFLDSRLTDGGEVVSLTRRPPFTPQEDSRSRKILLNAPFFPLVLSHELGFSLVGVECDDCVQGSKVEFFATEVVNTEK